MNSVWVFLSLLLSRYEVLDGHSAADCVTLRRSRGGPARPREHRLEARRGVRGSSGHAGDSPLRRRRPDKTAGSSGRLAASWTTPGWLGRGEPTNSRKMATSVGHSSSNVLIARFSVRIRGAHRNEVQWPNGRSTQERRFA